MIALNNILVATDFSEASDAALLYGRNFARTCGARLHVLHVVGDVASEVATPIGLLPNVGPLQLDLETDARRRLDDLLSDEAHGGLRAVAIVLTSATTAQTILEYARREQIDLIVVGTHGRRGIAHFFMGSVAESVVRLAPCPVLTVRHPQRECVVPDALVAAASH